MTYYRMGCRGGVRALHHKRHGARDSHVNVIVMTRASPTGSRLVRQLLHANRHAAPLKRCQMPPKTLPDGR